MSFYRLPETLDKTNAAPDSATPTRTKVVTGDAKTSSITRSKRIIPKKSDTAPTNIPLKSPARRNVVSTSTIRRTLDNLRVEKPVKQEDTSSYSPTLKSANATAGGRTSEKQDDPGSWIVKNGNKLKQLLRKKTAGSATVSPLISVSSAKKKQSSPQRVIKQKLPSKRSYTRREPRPISELEALAKRKFPSQLIEPIETISNTEIPQRTRVLRSRRILIEPIPLSKKKQKERQKPMVIELERLTHKANRDKRFKVNRLDALKHLITNFQCEQPKEHDMIDKEFRLNVVSYMDNLLSLSSNVQDILKRLKQIQKEKNDWRQRIFDLRKDHSAVGNELSELRRNHNQIKDTHEDARKMAELGKNALADVDANESTVMYLADILRELFAQNNKLDQLKLLNSKVVERKK